MNGEKIGKFIQRIRKEKNLTQEELATKIGVTDRAVGNWENGRRLPDYSILKDLCDALGITVNELLSGEKLPKNEYLENAEKTLINLRKQIDRKQKLFFMIERIVFFICILMFIINIVLNYIYRDNFDNTQVLQVSDALLIIGCFLLVITEILKFDK